MLERESNKGKYLKHPLINFIRGFRRAYKQGGGGKGGLKTGPKRHFTTHNSALLAF